MAQPLRTTVELYLSEEMIRTFLGLSIKDIILAINRPTFRYGQARHSTIDTLGFVVVVEKAP